MLAIAGYWFWFFVMVNPAVMVVYGGGWDHLLLRASPKVGAGNHTGYLVVVR